MSSTRKLVLLRHGESDWNREGIFTGWTDVDLSEKGIQEAREAGRLLKREGYSFDLSHTSLLKRAIRTLWLVVDEMDLMWIPVHRSWRLNERHYGALQGLNKADTAERFGIEQVRIWRRSYDVPPPPLDPTDERYPGRDPRYAELAPSEVPLTESLADVVKRFLPCWNESISPQVRAGKRVLVTAHGNSLRALSMYLDGLSPQEVVELNIPTGIPLVYELDSSLAPVRRYYLGDPEKAAKAAASVGAELERKPD